MMTEEQIDENCHLIGDLIERMISDGYLEMRYTDRMTGRRQYVWTGKQPSVIGSKPYGRCRPFTYRTQFQLPDDPNGEVWKWTGVSYSQFGRRISNLKILLGYETGLLDYTEVEDIIL